MTLITDASFSYGMRRGTWAFRVKSDRGEFWGSDAIRCKINNSTVAELCAVAKGVHHSFVRGHIVAGDTVIVRIDNLSAIMRLDGSMKKSTMKQPDLKLAITATQIVHSYRDDHDLKFDFRHIKGHDGTASPDKYIHDKVDKLAAKELRKLKKLLKEQEAANA